MEPASLFVGVALKVATGRRLAYNSREDYPMSLAVNTHLRGLTGLLHAVFARLEAILLLFVDHCFAVTAPMASRLRGRRRPSSLLMNLPLREFGSEISMSRASPSDPFGVIFTGYPTMPVAMSEMIEALALLRGRGHDASLTFLGCPPDHPAALEWLATTARLSLEEWVHLLPEVAPREVACHLAKAHCGSILYRPTGYTRRVVHVVKLYEYMACGLPIVASNFPGLTKTIEAEECGVVADPCSPTAIADALERLILDPEYAARLADNGRRAFLDRFSWEVVGLEYVSVMEGLGLQKKQLQGAGSSPSARP
jgi:glycosyltransferase involved in cell wall biosynthesis